MESHGGAPRLVLLLVALAAALAQLPDTCDATGCLQQLRDDACHAGGCVPLAPATSSDINWAAVEHAGLSAPRYFGPSSRGASFLQLATLEGATPIKKCCAPEEWRDVPCGCDLMSVDSGALADWPVEPDVASPPPPNSMDACRALESTGMVTTRNKETDLFSDAQVGYLDMLPVKWGDTGTAILRGFRLLRGGGSQKSKLLEAGRACATQAKYLGIIATPELCYDATIADAACGPAFMFAPVYHASWGCRCCTDKATTGPSNNNWALYDTGANDKFKFTYTERDTCEPNGVSTKNMMNAWTDCSAYGSTTSGAGPWVCFRQSSMKVKCPGSHPFLKAFRLRRTGSGGYPDWAWEYTCQAYTATAQYPVPSEVARSTGWNDIRGGGNNAIYLDRHKVDCGGTRALTGFQFSFWYSTNGWKLTIYYWCR